MVNNFSEKYGEEKLWMMHKSLVYFEDAENELNPELLSEGVTWEKVKKYLQQTFSKSV
jgi:hypothetical protein